MKNKSLLNIFAFALLTAVVSGCSLFSPDVPDTNYYDLTFEEKTRFVVPYQIEFRNFQNISPVKMNLLYTKKDSLQVLDQYNFWTQSPEIMLQRYLLNAVKADDRATKTAVLTISVYDFKFNVADKKCELGVTVRIMESYNGKKTEKNYMIKVPVDSVERTSFVRGMNKCALEFTKQLVKDIQKF